MAVLTVAIVNRVPPRRGRREDDDVELVHDFGGRYRRAATWHRDLPH